MTVLNRRLPRNRRFGRAFLALALGLGLTPVALAGPVRCTTYHERTLDRWHTICADGTKAISTYNKTLDRWDTAITPPPGKACTGQLNPRTWQMDVRCR